MFKKGGRYRVDNMRKDLAKERGKLPPKSLMMMPARLAIAMQEDGWILRSDIIWHKPNCMPESATDRPTSAHEHIFLFAKRGRYFYDAQAIAEPASENTHSKGPEPHEMPKVVDFGQGIKSNGSWSAATWGKVSARNKRNVWTIPSHSFPGAHFATFAPALVEPCILAGSSAFGVCGNCGSPYRRMVERGASTWEERKARGEPMRSGLYEDGNIKTMDGHELNRWKAAHPDTTTGWQPTCTCNCPDVKPAVILDCFSGAATTGIVALRLGRRYLGIELNAEYVKLSEDRILNDNPLAHVEQVEARINEKQGELWQEVS